MKVSTVGFLLLAGCLCFAADYPLTAHVSAVGERKVSNGETPITNTYNGQIVTTIPNYKRVHFAIVEIGGYQYTVEGKRPLAIGDYQVRFGEKHHQRSLEFLFHDGTAIYLVTEEAEAR